MVDFSAFTLIGVNLSNKGKFSSEKEPFRVYENDNGIIVEYGFVGLSVPSADPASAFGLIPKSSQPITFQARP
jgi:hypothetical protein